MCSIYPALSTMLMVIGKIKLADCWIHFLPQIIGATLATIVFKTVNPTIK